MVDRARYCFKLTAWNELAGVDDAFLLIYYVRNDGSNDIEIQDPKHKKRFLTRIAYPQLRIEDVRPGGRIMIYARQYKVRAGRGLLRSGAAVAAAAAAPTGTVTRHCC